jgi:hypothetical protein
MKHSPADPNAIRTDLADQVGRNLGRVDARFCASLARRLRRKFGEAPDPQTLQAQAAYFAEIYCFSIALLPECVRPSADGYARLENVDDARLLGQLAERYPEESAQLLNLISGWAVFYEYLR